MTLSELCECPWCGALEELTFDVPEGAEETQDVIEAPTQLQKCTQCGGEWEATYSGWTQYDDV